MALVSLGSNIAYIKLKEKRVCMTMTNSCTLKNKYVKQYNSDITFGDLDNMLNGLDTCKLSF